MYESKSKMFGLALSPTEREAIRKLAQLEGGAQSGRRGAAADRPGGTSPRGSAPGE
jgi:hypothetical protein